MSRKASPIRCQAAVLPGQSLHGRPRHLLAEAMGVAGRQPPVHARRRGGQEGSRYERRIITPFGSVRPWPVIADERACGSEIILGAGEHGLALAVDADEIVQALEASVTDISDPEPVASAGR